MGLLKRVITPLRRVFEHSLSSVVRIMRELLGSTPARIMISTFQVILH